MFYEIFSLPLPLDILVEQLIFVLMLTHTIRSVKNQEWRDVK